jgi:SAM-dependent methyltransferase
MSATRTRFLLHLIQARPGILQTDGLVLHFAPENCLRKRLSVELQSRYVTTDLRRHDVTTNQDITNMTFDDGSFATVICSHVLEHIPDDQRALRELHRVIRPGGTALIQVPLSLDAPTDEDPTVTDPAERKRRWGEHDHLRTYGLDLTDRLCTAGFDVDVVICGEVTPESVQNQHGLDPNGRIFLARR